MLKRLVHIDDRSAEELANAIIAQAVKDYCAAKMDTSLGVTGGDTIRLAMDQSIFFRTSWFEELSGGMDGESIIRRLDKKCKEFVEKSDSLQPVFWNDKEEADSCKFTCPFCGGEVKVGYNVHRKIMQKGRQGFSIIDRFLYYSCGFCTMHRKIPYNPKNKWWREWIDWSKQRKYLLCSAATASTGQNR